jgi:hypothetical protein
MVEHVETEKRVCSRGHLRFLKTYWISHLDKWAFF